MMKLTEYPSIIYEYELKVIFEREELLKAQRELDSLDAQIDREIAFDSQLKNELQRKSRRKELQSGKEYLEANLALDMVRRNLYAAEAELKLYKNEFSVVKILEKAAICEEKN